MSDPRGMSPPLFDAPRVTRPRPRILAVGGGKGGVGKTFLTANLAASLARAGQSTIVVDADLEGANLHTCLGVPPPRVSLADYVSGREDDLAKLLCDTPLPGLRLIAATEPHLASAQPSHQRRERLIDALSRLPAQWVVVDLGAGIAPALIDYFLGADDGIVVMTAEPTAVENAYGFLRAAFYHRMRGALEGQAARRVIAEAMDQHNERGIRTPLDLLREVQAVDPVEGERFVAAMRAFRPRLVVNGVRSVDEIKLGFSVKSVCHKYFGIDVDYLGYVNHDEAVRKSVMARRPLVTLSPANDAAVYVDRIARKLLGPAAPVGARPGGSLA